MSEVLPNGWVETSLKDIVTYKKGRKPKNTIPEEKEGYIPYLLIDEMEGKPIRCYTDDDKIPIAQKNDVLIVWDGSIGKTATGLQGAIGSTIAALTPVVIPEHFLEYFLKTAKPFIEQTSRGTGLQHINPKTFWPLSFPLPPLNEQKRIVAKLDAIMPRIEVVKERLEKVPRILKRFRQSVLSAAVTGKLTEQWRGEHPEVESAEVLVKSLFKKRLEKCSTPGQKQKIDSLYKETETEDDNNIPESWRFTFLSKICESFQYGTSAKSDKEGKVVVLRMGNLQNGKIDWSELAYTSDDKEIEKYLLEKNTVLFNRTNSPELVGKTSIYNGDRKAIFAGYLIRINSYSDVLDSHYLNFALNTGYAREFCHREKTDGVSQSNINAQKLAHFELPLPPLEEQKEIVRQVDKLFALADKVEEHYKKAKAKVDNLSQSVLAKAFRGELVPQDPNDEPAEKLLERIMEEKAKMESAFKTMKKKVSQKIKENKNSISGD
jgi:type I restriction enzyme S subunit